MKSTKTLIMAAAMLALPFVFTSCDEIFGDADPAPIFPSDVPPTSVVEDAKVLGAALEVGATVTVNYTVGTSSYVATFKKNADDSYTLISNTKTSAARAATRAADPAYTVPTGDGAAIGSNIQLTLVGDKLVLIVKDTAGTPLFEAQMNIEGGEVVVINTNAAGLDCTISSVGVDDEAKAIKNPEMKSVKLMKGVLSYAVKYIEGETWADAAKRYENIEMVEISTEKGYISAKFSKELVVETLMANGLEEAVAEDYYTNYFSGSFFLTNSIGNYIEATDVVGTSSTYTLTLDTPPLLTPLTFEAVEAGAQVTFTINVATGPVEYSTDGTNWSAYTSATPITLAAIGDKVMFRGTNAAYGDNSQNSIISCDKECYIYGNIMSLIKAEGFETETTLPAGYTFKMLFQENAKIKNHTDATKYLVLPATTLTDDCYSYMFSNCVLLETAPELPATTLTKNCYYFMFSGCQSLTTAPVLPAKELKSGCYAFMFDDCSSLNYLKCLATSIASDAEVSPTFKWLNGVPAGGIFVVADKTKYGAGLFWDPVSGDPNKCEAPSGWTVKNPDE